MNLKVNKAPPVRLFSSISACIASALINLTLIIEYAFGRNQAFWNIDTRIIGRTLLARKWWSI